MPNFKSYRTITAFALGISTMLTSASGYSDEAAEANTRCAIRLQAALTDRIPPLNMSLAADPKSRKSELLRSSEFIHRFAVFINTQFNIDAERRALHHSPAYMFTKQILSDRARWSNMFIGPYQFIEVTDDQEKLVKGSSIVAIPKTSGTPPTRIGYFESPRFKEIYIGNAPDNVLLVTAYRILHNVAGVNSVAMTNTTDAEIAVAGRNTGACASCHYNVWWGLDKVASVLPKKRGDKFWGANNTVAREVFPGTMIKDQYELLSTLVKSENFNVNACTLAFKFLYGRQPQICDGKVFDSCVTAFKKTGLMQDALGAIIDDPGFCQ